MEKLTIIILILFLTGCATTTKIWLDDVEIAKIKSKSDAIVEVERDGTKIIVDNRGRPSLIEQIITMPLLVKPVEIKGDK